jgi:tRNA(Ile)-lysidine synthase
MDIVLYRPGKSKTKFRLAISGAGRDNRRMAIQEKFAAKIESLLPRGKEKIAVALSGGSDSMALALLAADWAKSSGVRIVALTVDHGLRPESAAEALQVASWMKSR